MSLNPQAELTTADRERGLRLLVVEAGFSGGAAALTSEVILTAFALHLGASNVMVGVLAAMPFLAQLLQLPAIQLIERWRRRKRIAVLSSLVGRTMLAVMAVLAFFSGTTALLIFLGAQMLLCGLGSVGGCAWNSWMRDLAPDDRLGDVFARRTVLLTAISLILGLVAALALDWTPAGSPARNMVFAAMFASGCVTGLISARIVAMMPEPLMPPAPGPIKLRTLLAQPLGDPNFRRLLVFVASWQFAINLATPFFTVFIVRQLHFAVSFVLLLSVASQVANILALRLWGRLSDRFANKSVLAVCAPAYILAIVAMIGASQLGDRGGGEAVADRASPRHGRDHCGRDAGQHQYRAETVAQGVRHRLCRGQCDDHRHRGRDRADPGRNARGVLCRAPVRAGGAVAQSQRHLYPTNHPDRLGLLFPAGGSDRPLRHPPPVTGARAGRDRTAGHGRAGAE